MIEAKPENLIGDRAYDSDPLDAELRKDGIEMIAPHRSNRSKRLGFFHIICESIELAFQDRVVPVQYIRKCGKRPIIRIVARHWREFIVQRQPQLEFQIIAHGVSR
jgi:hypothetical protein